MSGFIPLPMMEDIKRLEDLIDKLAERVTALENPRCCKGGPQWGHAWGCPKCPD